MASVVSYLLMNMRINMFSSSNALKGDGIEDGVKWLVESIKAKKHSNK